MATYTTRRRRIAAGHGSTTTKTQFAKGLLFSDSAELWNNVIRKRPLLSADQEKELARRIELGDTGALDYLVECNLRLVLKIATHFTDSGLPYEDLVQEGNIGLIRAAEKFDRKRGIRFSTYATFWIRQSIIRGMHNKGRMIRLPVNKEKLLRKINRISSAYRDRHDRYPSDAEISDELSFGGIIYSAEDISELRQISLAETSLDEITTDGKGPGQTKKFFVDTIADEQSIDPESIVDQISIISRLTAHLDPREVFILNKRYGLTDGQTHSLGETGLMLNLTRERVRQIEYKALSKLRSHGQEIFDPE